MRSFCSVLLPAPRPQHTRSPVKIHAQVRTLLLARKKYCTPCVAKAHKRKIPFEIDASMAEWWWAHCAPDTKGGGLELNCFCKQAAAAGHQRRRRRRRCVRTHERSATAPALRDAMEPVRQAAEQVVASATLVFSKVSNTTSSNEAPQQSLVVACMARWAGAASDVQFSAR